LGIAIRSGYRDVGIGTELLREAEVQARRLGLKILTLDVIVGNDSAYHTYEKNGYSVVGRVPGAYLKGGQRIDQIIMVKDLDKISK
jgi:ribosomal protein S18 acetylase RimI-like enzyme